MVLALGAVFCTVAGYFARAADDGRRRAPGRAPLSFGQLHAVSAAFYVVKAAAGAGAGAGAAARRRPVRSPACLLDAGRRAAWRA
ncbi:MAG: hypothetical protein MZW92_25850 [Comamonadaceae bacterium]|nr:hypothetical protein [Comamonadaceae bacterium]